MTEATEAPDTTDVAPRAAPSPSPEPAGSAGPTRTGAEATAATCPYLESADGAWRMSAPSRDHRCVAVDPPAAQPADKQRRHCLSADHVDCPLYRAARTARATSLAAGADPALVTSADRRRRPLARTAPILLEPPRLVDRAMRLQLERAPGQLALIALMVVAFAIVALTRLSGGGSGTTPTPVASTPAAAPSASTTPRPTPAPTVVASAGSSGDASAGPSAGTTYKVKKGDTLVKIAAQFGTTAAKIRALNGLASNTIRVGQVLKIP